jgi:hypothetical protein
MKTTMDEEGMAVNGAVTVHDVHMRGLSKKHVEKDVRSSMPSRMYVAPEVYELERRAIFSKRWFLVSHKARYRNVGDFVLYEMAGFSFVVVRNKEQRLVGFHNTCRCVPPMPLECSKSYIPRVSLPADIVLSRWCRRNRVMLRYSPANIMVGRMILMGSLRRRHDLIPAASKLSTHPSKVSFLSMFMWTGMASST